MDKSPCCFLMWAVRWNYFHLSDSLLCQVTVGIDLWPHVSCMHLHAHATQHLAPLKGIQKNISAIGMMPRTMQCHAMDATHYDDGMECDGAEGAM